jgi:hypothetical protein
MAFGPNYQLAGNTRPSAARILGIATPAGSGHLPRNQAFDTVRASAVSIEAQRPFPRLLKERAHAIRSMHFAVTLKHAGSALAKSVHATAACGFLCG